MTFSPDGSTLAGGDADGVWMWKWQHAKFPIPFARDALLETAVCSLSFSPNGELVAWAEANGVVHVHDVRTEKRILHVKGRPWYEQWHREVAFSRDSKLVALAKDDRVIMLRAVKDGAEIALLKQNTGKLEHIEFSPDGALLASGSTDGTLRLWDVAARKEYRCFKGHSEEGFRVVFAPGSKLIATGDAQGVIRVWDIATAKVTRTMQGQPTGIMSLAYAPDGNILVSAGDMEALRFWDVSTGAEIRMGDGHVARVRRVRYSPDGRKLVSASNDGTFGLWDVATKRALWAHYAHGATVRAATFSPDGQTIVTAGDDGTVKRWTTDTGKLLSTFVGPNKAKIHHLVYCSDGQQLAFYPDTHPVMVVDAISGKRVLQIDGADHAYALAGSPSGSELAIAYSDTLAIWDLIARQRRLLIPSPENVFPSMAYSPDGRMLAVTVWESRNARVKVKVYESATGQLIGDFRSPLHCVAISVEFSNDGRILACGTKECGVAFWDIATRESLSGRKGDCGNILSIAWSPKGKNFATGNSDTTIVLWSAPKAPSLTPEQPGIFVQAADELWNELANQAPKAHEAIWQLVANRDSTSAFLKKKLRAIEPADPVKIASLIANLSSTDFQIRDQASRALENVGDLVIPALHKRLKEQPSLEERTRIDVLLRKALTWEGGPLRTYRAIQVLEYIGTLEAAAILQTMARGAPESRLTQAAQASLKRLRN